MTPLGCAVFVNVNKRDMDSKKGACSSHTQAARGICLQHARREGYIPSYVNSHLTADNRTVYEADFIRGRKSILPFIRQAEKLYREKTGQKVQKSFTPFRESCLVLRKGITDQQLLDFKESAEKLLGWKCVGIWLHQDEGHYHSKYIEGDDSFAINYHAHVLWDCQDHSTGKVVRIDRKKLSQMQDLLAKATGMERGNYAKDTGKGRRSAMEQRIAAQEMRIAKLDVKQVRKEVAISSAKAIGEAIKGLVGQSSKDREIEALKRENEKIQGENEKTKTLFSQTGTKKDKEIASLRQKLAMTESRLRESDEQKRKWIEISDRYKQKIDAMDKYEEKRQRCADIAIDVMNGRKGEKWLEDAFSEMCEAAGADCYEERHIVAQRVTIDALHGLSNYEARRLDNILDEFAKGMDDRHCGLKR